MKNLDIVETRLKNIIIADKKENPAKIERVLKSEIYYLLKNYLDINSDEIVVDIAINEFGKIEFYISGVAIGMKSIHTFNP